MAAPTVLSLSATANIGTTASVNYFAPLGASGGTISRTIAENQLPNVCGIAGMFSNFSAIVKTNARTTTITATLRKNGGATLCTLSIPAASTGLFQDMTDTATVAQGDTVDAEFSTGSGTGNWSLQSVTANFTASSGNAAQFFCSFGSGPSGGLYPVGGNCIDLGSAALNLLQVQAAGTLSYFQVGVSVNTSGTTTAIQLEKNGSTVNQAISIPAGSTGVFTDTTHTDAVVAGDTIIANTATAPVTITGLGVWFQATTDGQSTLAASSPAAALSPANNQCITIQGGLLAIGSGNEAQVQSILGVAGTISNLAINLVTNGTSGTTTWALRKNAVNGNCTVSIPSGSTGTFTDTTHSDTVAATDLLNVKVTGISGTAPELGYISSLLVTSAGNVYNVSLSENGSASDALSDVATLPSTVSETGAAADTPSDVAVYPSAVIDALAATDSPGDTAVYPSVVAETGTPNDVINTTAVFPSTLTEAATAADSEDTTAIISTVVSEAASAADAQSDTVVLPSSISEAGNAADVQSGSLLISDAVVETASASDNISDNPTYSSSIEESADAEDQTDAALSVSGAIIESASAADHTTGVTMIPAHIAESGSAQDTVSAMYKFAATLSEAAAAADVVAAQAVFIDTLHEIAEANDTLSASAIFDSAIVESVSAQDVISIIFIEGSRCQVISGAPRRRVVTGPCRQRVVEGPPRRRIVAAGRCC